MKTNQTDNATARPWHNSYHKEYGHIVFANGVPLATCEPNCDKEIQNANAALIVQAVNERDALVTVAEAAKRVDLALRALVNGEVKISSRCAKLYSREDYPAMLSEHCPKVIEARAAIAQLAAVRGESEGGK